MHAPRPTCKASTRSMVGFTAIELMVVVSIIAILAALAAPSFTPLIESWRVRQATEQLQSTLHYARSEAIKRGGRVAIEKIPNNTNGCTTASGKRRCNAGEPALQRIDTPSKVQVSRTGGGASIKLNRWGLVDGAWPGFSLVPLDKPTTHPGARGVCMTSGGRIRVIPPKDIPCTG